MSLNSSSIVLFNAFAISFAVSALGIRSPASYRWYCLVEIPAFSAICTCVKPCFCLVVLSFVFTLTTLPFFHSNMTFMSCSEIIVTWHLCLVNTFFKKLLEVALTFSERIIELKNSRNLLQKDIAQAINITIRQYYRYEKGQTQPTLPVLLALADYFDVSIDYLVGRSDDPKRY